MEWLRNRALQVAAIGVAFYWGLVFLLGSDRARDAVDILVTIVSVALLFRLMPHAFDRFIRGGKEKRWQVIMAMALAFAALPALAMWAFAVRYYDATDPALAEWMRHHPINGFFRLWSFGAVVMIFSAITDVPEGQNRPALYYLAIGLLGGVFIGAAIYKVFSP